MKFLLMCTVLVPLISFAGTDEHIFELHEARKTIEKAYVESREFCLKYPHQDKSVTIFIDGHPASIQVKCEVVNAYLSSYGRIKPEHNK